MAICLRPLSNLAIMKLKLHIRKCIASNGASNCAGIGQVDIPRHATIVCAGQIIYVQFEKRLIGLYLFSDSCAQYWNLAS